MHEMKVGVFSLLLSCAGSMLGMPAPIAHWTFDDPENLGKDSIGDNGLIACVATASYGTPRTVADGHAGAACDLRRTSSPVGNAFRSLTGNLPTGTAPFTFSAWLRPNSASAKTAYLAVSPAPGPAS